MADAATDSPTQPSPIAQALPPPTADATGVPTLSSEFKFLTSNLAVEEAQVNADLADRSTAERQLATDKSFDPVQQTNAEVGPVPKVFPFQPPQDHFDSIMNQAPLLMAFAAMGGSFGRLHGLNMLQSTNAMMKGLVQGNDAAYQDARKKYDQQYAEWQDKQKMWFDVYKTYQTAYKGRIDVDEKAVTAANRAVGVDSAPLKMTRQQISMLPELQAKIAKQNADISHMSAEELIQWARIANQKDTVAQRGGKGSAKTAETGQEAQQAMSTIDDLEKIIDNNNFVTGFGGTARRLGEFVSSSITGSGDLPATDFASKMHLLSINIQEVMKNATGRMGVDQRNELRQAISGLENATSGPQAKLKLDNVRSILSKLATPEASSGQPARPGQDSVPTATNAKGEKMYYRNGQWVSQ